MNKFIRHPSVDRLFAFCFIFNCRGILAALILLLAGRAAMAGGTWTALSSGPPTGVNEALLLTDGTVLTDDGNGDCNKLTPDIHGSYIHGTWTRLTPMNRSRLFFSTQVLTNGNVFVAGGEYGMGTDHAELYDPLKNVWTPIADPIPSVAFSDSASEIMANGNVLVAPVSQFGGCLIYNVASNSWQTAASTQNQNETCWVKMTNDCILTIDTGTQNSEHYAPSANAWVSDGTVPVVIYGYGAELGAGFLLPNGKVFFIGGTTNTAIYTPGATATSSGSWVAGPPMVFGANQLGAVDAPAAMMVNGKILCAIGPVGGFNSPVTFVEYDYVANAFTQVTAPGGGSTYNSVPYATSMLDLPDGTVLYVGGQNSTSLYVYTPDGTPLAAGQPAINTITENADGSYHVTGTTLTGISDGAEYGDDEQMNSNYPLVRMTNNVTGNVYYARTYNWSTTSLQTGSRIVTTEFTLPQNLPAGTYSLVAVANGNPSAPNTFTYSPPAVPTGLTAASGSNTLVTLNWNASANATAYDVKRSLTSSGYFATLATTSGLSYTNTGLTNGLVYYYKVSAVGSSGPSSDSAAVSAIPAGPPVIPGATNVSLAAYYNRTGIDTDGHSFSTGLDGGSTAYSGNLLGSALLWNNLVFNLGPANSADVVTCAGQTITLPAGQYNTLEMLATGVQGGQTAQTFTVTYADGSAGTFTQNFSDWANSQSYFGEATAITMPYRDTSGGGNQVLNVSVYGYVFALNPTNPVASITLPSDGNVIILGMVLANNAVSVNLSSFYNRNGIYTDGTTFTNPATSGFDGSGNYALSGTLLGSYQIWTNTLFYLGPLNALDVVSCTNQIIPLPQGSYARIRLLATAVNGNQTSQTFIINYTDGSSGTYLQSMSDWFTPAGYSGETKAIPMSQRNSKDGSLDKRTFYLYGYTFALNTAKTVQSIKLPNNANVVVSAISVIPNWPPTFNFTSLTLTNANAGHAYSANIATNASDLNADSLTFAKVSGPAWLNVPANGVLSGAPANSDANTNVFVVSVRDSGGLSNTATLYIYVNGAPTFTVNPFSPPSVMVGQGYSDTIATNASDPNPTDALTFSKISGPAWLTVAANGAITGTPQAGDAGTNSFIVSAADPYGLSGTATMNLIVTTIPQFVSTLSFQDGSLVLNWAGGNGPFQVQATTNLLSPDWENVGDPISSNSFSISPTNDMIFYRIVGQ